MGASHCRFHNHTVDFMRRPDNRTIIMHLVSLLFLLERRLHPSLIPKTNRRSRNVKNSLIRYDSTTQNPHWATTRRSSRQSQVSAVAKRHLCWLPSDPAAVPAICGGRARIWNCVRAGHSGPADPQLPAPFRPAACGCGATGGRIGRFPSRPSRSRRTARRWCGSVRHTRCRRCNTDG